MDTVKEMRLIETTLARRGWGKENSPVRVLTQYWTPEGELLAERDPDLEMVMKQLYALYEQTIPASSLHLFDPASAVRWAVVRLMDSPAPSVS